MRTQGCFEERGTHSTSIIHQLFQWTNGYWVKNKTSVAYILTESCFLVVTFERAVLFKYMKEETD